MHPVLKLLTGSVWIPVLIGTALADEHGHGHSAHQHGIGQLSIAIDGALVELQLESPAANLIGFEHRPRNDEQRTKLDQAISTLRAGDRLFEFVSSEANCILRDVRLLSALLGEEEEHDHEHEDEHEHEDDHGHADHDDEAHADLFAAWKFECGAAGVLREIDARGLFRQFPSIEKLRTQAVTDRGQTAGSLTPESTRIAW